MKNKNKTVFKGPLSKKLVWITRCGAIIFNIWVDDQMYHIFGAHYFTVRTI